MIETKNVISLAALVAVVTIVGTAFAISLQFVSKDQFSEFKTGTIASIDNRLDRIESKLDKSLQQRHAQGE